MKKTIVTYIAILLLATSCSTTAPVPNSSIRYVSYSDSTARFSIGDEEVQSVKSPSTIYYSYRKNAIHSNEGAIDGYPLHGDYIVYGSSNNLICKGHLKNGVKVGEWIRWDSKGKIISMVKYSNGKLVKVLLPKPVNTKKRKTAAKVASDTSKRQWFRIFRKSSNAKKNA
ncbi:hypothetical protein [uncultured Acetobacteroides sp.]|uniref:toxin-antitoxin system YwqK family antitoxin n=1 Tax=uncultured Acetobacteroides sp. TaxID=1760811 RepID=UPI0029F595D5|nr:hypothetical protein [uncultured Acetobacteroides sp.]